jgi:hypothetical protein
VIREFSDSASRSENSTSPLAKYLNVDAIGEHCAQHAEALLALEAIILSGDSQADSGQRQLGRKLEWFIDHAINHDAQLKELFEGYFTNLCSTACLNSGFCLSSVSTGTADRVAGSWYFVKSV